MKLLTSAMLEHLASPVATLCTCWKLSLANGTFKYFTDHNTDILVDEKLYLAAGGYKRTAIAVSAGLTADNLDVEGVLTSEAITEADLLAGLYDYARVDIFMVNYLDPAMEKIPLVSGRIGEVSLTRNGFSTKIAGLNQAYSQTFGKAYTPECTAIFGDQACKKPLAGFTHSGTVSSVTDNRTFSATGLGSQGDGYFDGGTLTWTTGDNAGYSMEIKSWLASAVSLCLPMSRPVAVGDAFTAVAGCDKKIGTCSEKFGNAVNFQGFPFIPGIDKMMDRGLR